MKLILIDALNSFSHQEGNIKNIYKSRTSLRHIPPIGVSTFEKSLINKEHFLTKIKVKLENRVFGMGVILNTLETNVLLGVLSVISVDIKGIMQNVDQEGTIVKKHDTPWSYIIQTEDGQFRRNRKSLQPLQPLNENGPRVQQELDELANNSSSSPRRESILPVHTTSSEVAIEVPQLNGCSPNSSTPAQRSQRSRKPVDRLDL
uniref:(California timema) hypothetical protein n=1 Tax=Timema californicum TaxID=61474 RepID=A0A7R9JCW7_TIMCA|nr:unnamed protein product [Timema californicum]